MFLEKNNFIINKKNGKINQELIFIFEKIKIHILKNKYSLSINFIDEKTAKKLNQKYRNKNYIPNILSFPISKSQGDIFICEKKAKQEYKDFDLNYTNFLILLIIHGCLHLKGFLHGEEMEKMEEKYLKKFRFK